MVPSFVSSGSVRPFVQLCRGRCRSGARRALRHALATIVARLGSSGNSSKQPGASSQHSKRHRQNHEQALLTQAHHYALHHTTPHRKPSSYAAPAEDAFRLVCQGSGCAPSKKLRPVSTSVMSTPGASCSACRAMIPSINALGHVVVHAPRQRIEFMHQQEAGEGDGVALDSGSSGMG